MTEYLLHKRADIGACMDVRGYAGRIYTIQRQNGGRLCVLDADLHLLSRFDGIGNARQIEIRDGIAFITAREDGLWILDVREPEPKLLTHYRTVEFATGITIYRNYAFVSCRQYGVEILDVSDLLHPSYVGVIRIGEIQSACVYHDVLYGGAWGEMKVVAVDISDIQNPVKLAEYPLSGRGDGVVVRDGILYASTGQHRRGIKNVTDENDPDFGMGNGVEIFDVRNPKDPKKCCFEFFGKGHSISYDMWKPMLCGNMLVCSDSILGVFGYGADSFEPLFHLSLQTPDGRADPVTGTTVHGGKLYVTSALGGLYVFDECIFEDPYRHDAEKLNQVPLPAFSHQGTGAELRQCYCGDFPVLGIAESGDYLALACGDGGIRILKQKTFTPVTKTDTPFYCADIKIHGEYVFAACAEDGISIYRRNGEALSPVSKLSLNGTVLQIEKSEHGEYLAATVGGSRVAMIDVRDRTDPKLIYTYSSSRGPLYGENFLPHRFGNAIALFWHREGLVYTDPEHGDREFHHIFFSMRNGFTGYCPGNGCDIDGDRILFVRKKGYILLPRDGSGYADDLPVYRADVPIRGKLCVCGNHLIATERAEGTITVTDISDIEHPTTLASITTNASCGIPRETASGLLIPGRYAGLLALECGFE